MTALSKGTFDDDAQWFGCVDHGLAAWTGFRCALVGLVALPLALFAAGSGHPGWAMVAAAVLLGSLGVGVDFVATVVHYDHRHHNRTPRLF